MGNASPKGNLDVTTTADNGNSTVFLSGGTGGGSNVGTVNFHSNSGNQIVANMKVVRDGSNAGGAITFATAAGAAAAERMRIDSGGNIRLVNVAGCGSGIKSDGTGLLSCITSSR